MDGVATANTIIEAVDPTQLSEGLTTAMDIGLLVADNFVYADYDKMKVTKRPTGEYETVYKGGTAMLVPANIRWKLNGKDPDLARQAYQVTSCMTYKEAAEWSKKYNEKVLGILTKALHDNKQAYKLKIPVGVDKSISVKEDTNARPYFGN